MSNEAAIAGLREQILANAVMLFPDSGIGFQRDCNKTSPPEFPGQAFHIFVIKLADTVNTEQFEAFMIHKHVGGGDPERGGAKCSVSEALSGLLDVTATKLGEKFGGGGVGSRAWVVW